MMSFNITLDEQGLLIFALLSIVASFFLLTLQNTLKAIASHNRRLSPGLVWLLFIPVFNIFWQFILVVRLADSIQNELDARLLLSSENTSSPGLAFCILPFFFWLPFLGMPLLLGAIACWVVYWIRVARYKKLFRSLPDLIDTQSEVFGSSL